LLVPQDREGTFSTRLFSRYQRNEKALVLALMEMYVEGVSTRKVKNITEELCGTSFSKSLISSLAGRLDSELGAWRSRPLEGEGYPYLFVDALYEKARANGRVVSQGVLIVSAVREDGMRESSRLVPRPLALLGLVGGPLLFASGIAVLLGVIEAGSVWQGISTLPVAAFEVLLGIWLIVKGFNPSAAASLLRNSG
jgi:hypothetical protein